MARYLVTGGAGFIGSHLCELLLAQNHNVCILDHLSSGRRQNMPENAEFIHGDIGDRALLMDIMPKMDGCFHLAAIASVPVCNEDWLNAHQVNLTNTLNIIDSARGNSKRKPVPVVFASSAAVYGNNTDLPLTEASITRPISIYGVNKLCCEYYLRVASELFQVPCTVLRLFNVYGPRQLADSSYSGVITRFINNINQGQPVTIYGSGEQTRDFIFVTDVARFFLAAMQTSKNSLRVLNVCTGKTVSVNHIAETLYHIFQKPADVRFEPFKPGDIKDSLGSPDLAKSEIGASAETPLEKGLEILAAFH